MNLAPSLSSFTPLSPSCYLLNLNSSSFTYEHAFRPYFFLQFAQPIVYSFKALGVGQIEYQKSYLRVSIVEGHYWSEPLISSSVPDVELYFFSRFGFYFFLLIGSGESGFVHFFEYSLFIAHGDGSFPDSSITAQNKFDSSFGRGRFM